MSVVAPALVAQSTTSHQQQQQQRTPPLAVSAKFPPCRVCGGKGSGVHYGVNTCIACKGFFGRCSANNTIISYQCKINRNCVIQHGRKCCPACRLQKCLQVGMSRQGIKIGRHSHAKETETIEEVKKLEIQLKIKEDGSLVSPVDHAAQIDDIIQRLTDVHFSYMPRSAEFYAHVVEKEEAYLQQKEMEHQLFGEKKVLCREEYNQFYNQTQIDLDGRRAVTKRLVPHMEPSIANYCAFARTIPGFNTMSVQDQQNLIKAGYMLSNCMLDHPLHNMDHGLFVYPQDTSLVLCLKEVFGFCESSTSREAYEGMAKLVKRTQNLDLTHEESVVAAALALMLADAELSPVGQKTVSASAECLAEAFTHLIDKNHDPEELTYARYISLLADLKTWMIDNAELAVNMIEDTQDVGVPDVMKAIMAEGVVI